MSLLQTPHSSQTAGLIFTLPTVCYFHLHAQACAMTPDPRISFYFHILPFLQPTQMLCEVHPSLEPPVTNPLVGPLNTSQYLSLVCLLAPPAYVAHLSLNSLVNPPEGLPPSVSLGPSTEHSRGWTASGDFLPLPHHLVTQTPRPRNKAGHYPLKTYETHHLPSFLSQVSQLCCK